jgi:excisionase family DNA binding protein
MSEPQPEYLTVSQASARLGVSERTLLKRIKGGEIEAEKRPIEGGGVAWRVLLNSDRAGSVSEAERKNAPEARRKPFESETASNWKRAGSEMENAPEVSEPRAGSEPEARIMERLESEVLFLRSMLEARERDAAELRSALREALKAMPKALPGENTPGGEKTTREDAPQATQTAPGDVAPTAQKQSAQRGTKPQRPKAWQRVAARILGIR